MTHTLPLYKYCTEFRFLAVPKVGTASTAVSTSYSFIHPINTTLAMQYLIIFGYPFTFLFLIQVQAGGMKISPKLAGLVRSTSGTSFKYPTRRLQLSKQTCLSPNKARIGSVDGDSRPTGRGSVEVMFKLKTHN